jgi:hypothetical protein
MMYGVARVSRLRVKTHGGFWSIFPERTPS